MAAVTICSDFGSPQNSLLLFPLFPHLFAMKSWDRCHDLHFCMLSFKPAFSLSSFTFIRGSLVLLCFLHQGWYHVHIWGYWYSSWQSWFQLVLPLVQHCLPLWRRWWRVCLQCGRLGFDPWVGMIPWRRKWQPTPVFLPGKFYGWRSLAGLAGYSPWGHRRVRCD